MRYCLFLLLALTLPASAQVYKWTDAEGNVHFGNQPPPEADEVDIRESAPGSMITEDQRRYLRQEESRRQMEGTVRSMKKVANEIRKGNSVKDSACTGAANQLKVMQESLARLPVSEHEKRARLRQAISDVRARKSQVCS